MSVVVVERLSWPDAVDVLIDRDRPDVNALRDQAQVLRARLEEIAREFADDPSILITMVRTTTKRVQAELGDIEAPADAGKVSVLGGVGGASSLRFH